MPKDLTQTKPFLIPGLDGLRALAFLLVFAGHSGWDKIVPGGFGVTVFFFLSGYLITSLLRLEASSIGTISLRNFYLRRALRILPPLYIVLAAGFVLGRLGVLHALSSIFAYFAAVTFTTNYYSMLPSTLHAQSPGMEAVWSLCVEEHFYLLFPLTYRLFLRKSLSERSQTTALFAACMAVLLWRTFVVIVLHNVTMGDSPKWSYTATDCRFDSILWGIILAIHNNPWFEDRPEGTLARRRAIYAALGLAGILISLLYRGPVFRETMRYTLQGLSLYPIFYYCIAAGRSWPVRVLQWHPLRWIGELSYTLYLCHYYILDEIQIRHPALGRLNTAILSLLLSVGFAWTMRKFVELPLRRWRQSFRPTDRRVSPVPRIWGPGIESP